MSFLVWLVLLFLLSACEIADVKNCFSPNPVLVRLGCWDKMP